MTIFIHKDMEETRVDFSKFLNFSCRRVHLESFIKLFYIQKQNDIIYRHKFD